MKILKVLLLNILLVISASCIASLMVNVSITVFYDFVLATKFWIFFGVLIQMNAIALIGLTIFYIRSLLKVQNV